MASMTQPSQPAEKGTTTTTAPPKISKRKSKTEKGMFLPNKRPKHDTNCANFAAGYAADQQKIRDELPIRSDPLCGIIVPARHLPKGKAACSRGKVTEGDPAKAYRYAALHGHKARVQRGEHVSAAVRERALARFPLVERREGEEEGEEERKRQRREARRAV